jgi:hypothetical protein
MKQGPIAGARFSAREVSRQYAVANRVRINGDQAIRSAGLNAKC